MINRRIRLDVVVERTFHDVAVDRADDAGGYTPFKSERAADRDHLLTRHGLVAVAKRRHRDAPPGVDLHQCDIGMIGHTDNARPVPHTVRGRH